MGLFSKKEYVCTKCNNTFQTRLKPAIVLCDSCFQEENDEQEKMIKSLEGYIWYHEKVRGKFYTIDEMKDIISKRNEIMEIYKSSTFISPEEIVEAGEKKEELTDAQIKDVIRRSSLSILTPTFGGVIIGKNFFLSTEYDGVLLDADDVFAIAYTADKNFNCGGHPAYLCVMFTNNPYVPVLGVLTGVGAMELDCYCCNLTYDVCTLKELKHQIKKAGKVEGDLDIRFVIEQINNALEGRGIFDTTKYHTDLMPLSNDVKHSMGYLERGEMEMLLGCERRANRKFWEKQISRYFGGELDD